MEKIYATEIIDAKYDFTSVRDVVNQLKHLSQRQNDDVHKILSKHEKLFDGTLGVYPHKKFCIDIEEDATPVHAKPYPVPRIHLKTFTKELMYLVKLGVLEPAGLSS